MLVCKSEGPRIATQPFGMVGVPILKKASAKQGSTLLAKSPVLQTIEVTTGSL